MQAMIKFIKTTVMGAIVVIIPMAVILLVLADVFNKLMTATDPLTKNMTLGPLSNAIIAVLFVVLVIILVFFIAGLLLNSFWGESIKNWLESKIFENIPMFSTIKQLTQRIAGIESSNFPVVEIDLYGTDVKVLGIAVEKLSDGRLMVYAPSSPMITVGQLYIVPADRAKQLDVSIPDTINCLSKLGLEADKIYQNAKPS